jgi:uncharacterized OB-fold protein
MEKLMVCNGCVCKPVCEIFRATGGVNTCEMAMEIATKEEPVVRAHWIYKPLETDVDIWLYHCSACANLSARPRAYCAECGAKMEEKVEHYDD